MIESEHCHQNDSKIPFHTSNYGITTTPAQEWEITMKRDAQLADMRHGRRLPDVEELLRSDTAAKADLKLVEVVVLVLYTGPMVRLSTREPPPECAYLAWTLSTPRTQPPKSIDPPKGGNRLIRRARAKPPNYR
jgi:hypothetical protein